MGEGYVGRYAVGCAKNVIILACLVQESIRSNTNEKRLQGSKVFTVKRIVRYFREQFVDLAKEIKGGMKASILIESLQSKKKYQRAKSHGRTQSCLTEKTPTRVVGL